ncbi:uncharacterized protein LY89DRAFT_419534 [Mollisia scopiformis]|uniref:Uncharacterized protein n=1 Tax=Mollisia scopiformis TaxID=149040 RepID=A0A194XLG9_MOLSC|nr:uncharacterized protein LY89DRAFT_419534 [Mollisia scopiformis]KUJ20929.1 hypothetical protein LY89DRAFT_419534 [Mollisia scopiformis]
MHLIQTKGRFNFMELPAELRLKIYELLLICNDDVELPCDGLGDRERQIRLIRGVPLYPCPRPAVAIMQTCRLANEEGVPILWGKNTFAICLPVDLMEPFFLHRLRWSTIQHMASLTFTSNTTPLPESFSSHLKRNYIRPHFACSGLDILARYSPTDFLYSPYGPDVCMSLSIRNWVSTNVTRAELNAIQQELEAMMANDPPFTTFQNAPDHTDADAQT